MPKDRIKIVEVGPRDGLQNESTILAPKIRAEWIQMLYQAGFKNIEVGSVVRADRIPQMADSEKVFELIHRPDGCDASVLVPNLRGLERIQTNTITEIGVFTAASETFNQKNINASIAQSLDRLRPVVEVALSKSLKVRGTVSCIARCPYEGKVDLAKVVTTCEALYDMGCQEIVLGDTIGEATPKDIRSIIKVLGQSIDASRIALHAHDTYNNAILNVAEALEMGIRTIDSAAAGLGGCPYAPGAKGNVNSRSVVDFCNSQGLETGIDLNLLQQAEQWILAQLVK